MSYTFLPDKITGTPHTTALNSAVTDTAGSLALTGSFGFISVGLAPIYIRFGIAGTTAVTSSTGTRLPLNYTGQWSYPEGCTHIHFVRDGAVSSVISIQSGLSGT